MHISCTTFSSEASDHGLVTAINPIYTRWEKMHLSKSKPEHTGFILTAQIETNKNINKYINFEITEHHFDALKKHTNSHHMAVFSIQSDSSLFLLTIPTQLIEDVVAHEPPANKSTDVMVAKSINVNTATMEDFLSTCLADGILKNQIIRTMNTKQTKSFMDSFGTILGSFGFGVFVMILILLKPK